MTDDQRQLAYELVVQPDGLRRVSPEDFAQRFPSALDGGNLALGHLNEAAHSQSNPDLEAAMIIGSAFGSTSAHVPILCELLCENWHFQHEEIVLTLQRLKDARAVDALYEASLISHQYLSYDKFYGLARKCTWALADIGTRDALTKLQLLAGCGNALIAKYAQNRLDNWDNEQDRKRAPNPALERTRRKQRWWTMRFAWRSAQRERVSRK